MSSILISGMGCVGKQLLHTFMMKNAAEHIGIISTKAEKADGILLDYRQVANEMSPNVSLINASYSKVDLSVYDFCFMTNGLKEIPDYDIYAKTSIAEFCKVADNLLDRGFKGHLIVISNPHDALVTVLSEKYGARLKSLLGTGTALDTYRLHMLRPDIDKDAYVIGKHGRMCVPLGVQLSTLEHSRLEQMGEEIMRLKNSSDIGISYIAYKLYLDLLAGNNTIASVYDGQYGCAFGRYIQSRNGKLYVKPLDLSKKQQTALFIGINSILYDCHLYYDSIKKTN